MTDPAPAAPSQPLDGNPKPDDFMPAKKRRNSIFSALRDLNSTAYPDRNYKNHLLDETKKWKWLIRNAVDLSASTRNNSTPNVSYSQDMSNISRMKAYVDERPDLEAFLADNARFFKRAETHLKRHQDIHTRFNDLCVQKQKFICEISNDVRDDILLDC